MPHVERRGIKVGIEHLHADARSRRGIEQGQYTVSDVLMRDGTELVIDAGKPCWAALEGNPPEKAVCSEVGFSHGGVLQHEEVAVHGQPDHQGAQASAGAPSGAVIMRLFAYYIAPCSCCA